MHLVNSYSGIYIRSQRKGNDPGGYISPNTLEKICLIRLYLFYLHSAQQQAQIYLQQYV